MAVGVCAFVVLAGLYALFAGALSLSELAAGGPSVAAAVLFVVLLHRLRARRFRLRAPWLRVLGRPVAALFGDAVKVGLALALTLWRRPAGMAGIVLRQPFRHGGDDPADAARRALTTLGSSLAPNGFVLRIPDGQDVLLRHCLVHERPRPDRDWPL